MSQKESPQEPAGASPIGEIQTGPSGFEVFLDAHQKKLMAIGAILFIAIIAYVIISGVREKARVDGAATVSAAQDLPTLRSAYEQYKDTPAGATALKKISRLQWADQQQAEAINTLESILVEYPDHPLIGSVQQTLGTYHRQLEDFDKAKSYFEAAVASDSAVSSQALIDLGDLALRNGDSETAKAALEDVAAKYGQRHPNFKQIAEMHQKLVGTTNPAEVVPEVKPEVGKSETLEKPSTLLDLPKTPEPTILRKPVPAPTEDQ